MASSNDILDQTVDADPTNQFADRVGAGDHVLALVGMEIKQVFDKKAQEKVWLVGSEWFVRESTTHKRGERRSIGWKIGAAGNYGKNERSRMNEAARAITESLGAKCGESEADVAKFKETVRKNLDKMLERDPSGSTKTAGRKFIGRGIVIRCVGSTREDSTKKDEATGKAKVYTNYAYSAVTQTPDQIKACRAEIEAAPASQPEPSKPAQPSTTKAEQPSKPATETASAEPDMLDGIM